MSELKLEVGKTYRTRDGQEVKITIKMDRTLHCFAGSNGWTYKDNGMWLHTQEMNEDLVEEITEPELKLEVGKKYRTRGGEVADVCRETSNEYFPFIALIGDYQMAYYSVAGECYTNEPVLTETKRCDKHGLIEEITEPEPKQQEIQPMFDKKYKYAARDKDGYSKFFIEKPSPNLDTFCWYDEAYSSLVVGKDVFNLGNDWKDSLREIIHNDDGSVYLRKSRHEFKVDDKVLVRGTGDSDWRKRHFCEYTLDGLPVCFISGQTSFTTTTTSSWDEIKPYEEE